MAEKTVTEKSRVLIIDDHPVVRRGLVQLINQATHLTVSGEAGNASEALLKLEEDLPDIVVVDISLGESNGLSLIRDIRNRFDSCLPVLVLSMHDEYLYAERALRAGANGYIMKEEAAQDVIHAIERVLRGEIHLSEHMTTRLVGPLVASTGEDRETSPLQRLTNRELEIFELIGRGRRARDIADALHVSVKTVEAHRQNIKNKLKLANSIEVLQMASRWVSDIDREDTG